MIHVRIAHGVFDVAVTSVASRDLSPTSTPTSGNVLCSSTLSSTAGAQARLLQRRARDLFPYRSFLPLLHTRMSPSATLFLPRVLARLGFRMHRRARAARGGNHRGARRRNCGTPVGGRRQEEEATGAVPPHRRRDLRGEGARRFIDASGDG